MGGLARRRTKINTGGLGCNELKANTNNSLQIAGKIDKAGVA